MGLAELLEIPSYSKVSLSIFQAANLWDLVFTRVYFSPRGFNNSFGGAGKNNRNCMGILSSRVYQGCVCHVSATSIIASKFFQRGLFVTQHITLKGGNAKPNILFQSYCIASVAKLFGSVKPFEAPQRSVKIKI